jgi:hypothetical protein
MPAIPGCYTGRRMTRRVFVITFAVVLALAPAASDICRLGCATQQAASADDRPHQHPPDAPIQSAHHHHDDSASPGAATINVVAHSCASQQSVVVEPSGGGQIFGAATISVKPGIPLLMQAAARHNAVDSRHGPPGPSRSIVQLRT